MHSWRSVSDHSTTNISRTHSRSPSLPTYQIPRRCTCCTVSVPVATETTHLRRDASTKSPPDIHEEHTRTDPPCTLYPTHQRSYIRPRSGHRQTPTECRRRLGNTAHPVRSRPSLPWHFFEYYCSVPHREASRGA